MFTLSSMEKLKVECSHIICPGPLLISHYTPFLFPAGLSYNLIFDLLSDRQGCFTGNPWAIYGLATIHTARSQGSRLLCVEKLPDRKHSPLIWVGAGIKRGLSVLRRVSCSVVSVGNKSFSQSFLLYNAILLLDFTILNFIYKIIISTVSLEYLFTLKEEKESSSLIDL